MREGGEGGTDKGGWGSESGGRREGEERRKERR